MRGFAIILGTTTFTAPGAYTAPDAFRSIIVTVTPGAPGNPGSPCPCGYTPGSPGSPGGASSYKGAGSATYLRSASIPLPRARSNTVIVGAGGAGGAGGMTPCVASGTPGCPGAPGSVTFQVI